MFTITLDPKDLTYEDRGGGLYIAVPGFEGDPEAAEDVQVLVEIYEGNLRVVVWHGVTGEPTITVCKPKERSKDECDNRRQGLQDV